jgi:hypothetical protein
VSTEAARTGKQAAEELANTTAPNDPVEGLIALLAIGYWLVFSGLLTPLIRRNMLRRTSGVAHYSCESGDITMQLLRPCESRWQAWVADSRDSPVSRAR